jgi:Flp pilus assembly protein TadB
MVMSFERIGSIAPQKFRDWVQKQLGYANLDYSPERFIGALLTITLFVSCFFGIIAFFAINQNPLIVAGLVFLVVFFSAIFLLLNTADAEGKIVEKILPDALELIASNIKSGMTTERALIASARPEFGALSAELQRASKLILSGTPIEEALVSIATKIKSTVLDRTMWLIAEGISNGGQIVNLLIQIGTDLREENALKAEVSANISMYVLLIFVSAAFGAPVLFGISSFIVGVLSEQTANSNVPEDIVQEYSARNPALGLIAGTKSLISEEFIILFVQITLIFSCVFSSMVLGIINTGKEKGGVKYIPIIFVISFALFHLTRIIVSGMFGGMIR